MCSFDKIHDWYINLIKIINIIDMLWKYVFGLISSFIYLECVDMMNQAVFDVCSAKISSV